MAQPQDQNHKLGANSAPGTTGHQGQLQQMARPQDTHPDVTPAHLHVVPGGASSSYLPL